jgi:3',5'-cyclic-AMP phosphodiesterase
VAKAGKLFAMLVA